MEAYYTDAERDFVVNAYRTLRRLPRTLAAGRPARHAGRPAGAAAHPPPPAPVDVRRDSRGPFAGHDADVQQRGRQL